MRAYILPTPLCHHLLSPFIVPAVLLSVRWQTEPPLLLPSWTQEGGLTKACLYYPHTTLPPLTFSNYSVYNKGRKQVVAKWCGDNTNMH